MKRRRKIIFHFYPLGIQWRLSYVLCALFSLIVFGAPGQTGIKDALQDNTDVIQITNVVPEGILLDKGWKYTMDDSPEFAKPEFDDSTWQNIDPTPDIHEIPPLWKSTMVWFRLHFKVDPQLIGPLALTIQQSGASEIYLNGVLAKRFGTLSSDPEKIVAVMPRFLAMSQIVTDSGEQVLAVRYALQPNVLYSRNWTRANPGLIIKVNTVENANNLYFQEYSYEFKTLSFRIGVFLIIGILYLSFYLSNTKQKINLQFSIYAFLQVIIWSFFYFYNIADEPKLQYYYYFANIILVVSVLCSCVLLSAIYHLLEQKNIRLLFAFYAFGLISVLSGCFIYGWGWLIYATVYTNVVNIEITRVAFKAVKQQKKGAWIIAAGGVFYLVCWLIFSVSFFFDETLFFNPYDFFALTHFSLPVTVSIYLGYDFALTHRSLQQKLIEVQSLSEEKNQILSVQKDVLEKQVSERTAALNQSLVDLKSTQTQLIHSEKMASLGELTAGIAHEIQNPLNFVNNFSDLNTELLDDLQQELKVGKPDTALSISNDIRKNEEKINHHGKRADSIVKGMLQHSRSSSGVKEPTDINALCDEYLRLSYHGLRAKDKSFNAKIETDFDSSLEKINIIPQDIGRVVLNLINNAFYAVAEKNKQMWERSNAEGQSFEPRVSISTKKIGENVVVSVKDNGYGIPAKTLDKIFQPFFTTKPSGQGTGLGLSLSYDIVKAHGGEIKVETEKNEGTLFIVQLPVQSVESTNPTKSVI